MHKLNIIKLNNATYRSETYKSFKIKLFLFLNKFYKTHFMLQLLYLFFLLFFYIVYVTLTSGKPINKKRIWA